MIKKYFGKNKKLLMALAAASTVAMVTSIAQTNGETGQQVYVNGTKVENTKVYISGGQTFVPAEDFAKAFGDETNINQTDLTINHNGNSYYFGAGENNYRVNGSPKNLGVTEKNGIKVPNGAKIKSINKKIYLPIDLLNDVFGYNIQEDTQTIWIGQKPSTSTTSSSNSTSSSTSSSLGSVTENMKKSLDNGWIAPQLPDGIRSTDDLLADSQALQKYLEFIQNGETPTSAKFNPFNNGVDYACVGVGPVFDEEFSSILFEGYYFPDNDGYMKKINYINPQVLKFYFPNSWEWIHNKYMSGDDLNGTRMTIDGRDTFFSAVRGSQTIWFSKIGGVLGSELPNLPSSSSGTIGNAYIASKGSWYQEGSNWKYQLNSGINATGWLNDNGSWYYLDNNGIMKTGWIQDNGNWYYCWSNGQMAANTTISGYYLGSDGKML